ncbi:MAG: hypothetical protein OXG82_17355 [Gammaproteobacteria bacterium]|nr:hypothetical protein [Gammaproteobacteria bacterium]
MDAFARSEDAPDLDALIAACIAGVDRSAAIRELNNRLAKMAEADETAVPLLQAVENLLDGVLTGTVSPVEPAMELVAESAVGLKSAGGSDRHLDLIERLDLMASGVTDVDLDSFAPASSSGEPPVLTEREDGSRVELGRFDEPSPGMRETTRDEPRTVGAIVEGMDAVVLRLADQLEAVRARVAAGRTRDAQRTVDELSETVRDLEDLKDALAKWSKESAALLSGR